jgi:hypothetical protein
MLPARTASTRRRTVDRRTVHERFEFWPGFEAVRTRNHELGVVQREGSRVRIVIVRVHFGDRGAVAFAERFGKLLRLTFELLEIRPIAKRARWERLSWHDELLSGRRLAVHTPGVRSLGQKRVHLQLSGGDPCTPPSSLHSARAGGKDPGARWTQSFPRTRQRPAALGAAYHQVICGCHRPGRRHPERGHRLIMDISIPI